MRVNINFYSENIVDYGIVAHIRTQLSTKLTSKYIFGSYMKWFNPRIIVE